MLKQHSIKGLSSYRSFWRNINVPNLTLSFSASISVESGQSTLTFYAKHLKVQFGTPLLLDAEAGFKINVQEMDQDAMTVSLSL